MVISPHHGSESPTIPPHHRQLLLTKVKNEAKQRLQSSLQKAVRLNLLQGEKPQGSGRLGDIEVKIPQLPNFFLPPEKSVIEVFEQASGKLLIVGEQGAGKTTALLKITKKLAILAEKI